MATILNTFGFLTILGGLAASIVLINSFKYPDSTLFIPIAGIGFTVLLSTLLTPLRTVIDTPTIRAFTEKTLALNYTSLIRDEGANRKEMEMVMNHIIADKGGLDIEEVTSEKRIVADLGIE